MWQVKLVGLGVWFEIDGRREYFYMAVFLSRRKNLGTIFFVQISRTFFYFNDPPQNAITQMMTLLTLQNYLNLFGVLCYDWHLIFGLSLLQVLHNEKAFRWFCLMFVKTVSMLWRFSTLPFPSVVPLMKVGKTLYRYTGFVWVLLIRVLTVLFFCCIHVFWR